MKGFCYLQDLCRYKYREFVSDRSNETRVRIDLESLSKLNFHSLFRARTVSFVPPVRPRANVITRDACDLS